MREPCAPRLSLPSCSPSGLLWPIKSTAQQARPHPLPHNLRCPRGSAPCRSSRGRPGTVVPAGRRCRSARTPRRTGSHCKEKKPCGKEGGRLKGSWAGHANALAAAHVVQEGLGNVHPVCRRPNPTKAGASRSNCAPNNLAQTTTAGAAHHDSSSDGIAPSYMSKPTAASGASRIGTPAGREGMCIDN